MIPAEVRLAKQALLGAGIEDAAFLAEILGCRARKCSRSQLLAESRGQVWTAGEIQSFQQELARVVAGEPIAYLEGHVGFYGREFKVTPAVLIPRADSETLLDLCLERTGQGEKIRVLDLGTGSGCLLLSLLAERPSWQGQGVDCSPSALSVAEENARSLGLEDRTSFVLGNWASVVPSSQFDLIVSNPPYVLPGETLGIGVREFEPALALFTPEEAPMQPYERILQDAARVLRPGGAIAFEVGAGRADAVAELCHRSEFLVEEIRADLAGIQRAVWARDVAKA